MFYLTEQIAKTQLNVIYERAGCVLEKKWSDSFFHFVTIITF